MKIIIIASAFISLLSFGHTENVSHAPARTSIAILLGIDRLDYYNKALSDALSGKQDAQLVADLRGLVIEDYLNLNLKNEDLNNSEKWADLTAQVLTHKFPNRTYLEDLSSRLFWNYNFFKNKLLGRYKIRDFSNHSLAWGGLENTKNPTLRTVPKIKGSKVLLDHERYISEKTSRAIVWDAIIHDREFEFHIGTEKSFQENLKNTDIEVIQEIIPLARNYNKIYLAYDHKIKKYVYIINQISGEDRVKHLMAQLRLITVNGKTFFSNKDKVHILGNASKMHQKVEAQLVDLLHRLPQADQVIIGQKSAFEDAIRSAGFMDVIFTEKKDLSNKLNLPNHKEIKFDKILNKVQTSGAFHYDVFASGPVDWAEAYKQSSDPFYRNYAQFNSEQQSHEFSDYLFQDKNGNIQRWRFFSAVWGDEIIPIAKALRKTGNHKNVVYIGTAGALINKGLKVGDLVAASKVQTHKGHLLDLTLAKHVPETMKRFTVGQVHTPFEETDLWLQKQKNNIDIVEVETGYLREHLGPQARLQAYFLISDIVGSDHETLAQAASQSTKRKTNQLKLISSLFQERNITSAIANFEMLPNDSAFKSTFRKVQQLRSSRDPLSQKQVAHLAVKKGAQDNIDLEQLLKTQKPFNRDDLSKALNTLETVLLEIRKSLPSKTKMGFYSETLMSGTFNPKMKEQFKVFAEGFSLLELNKKIGLDRWTRIQSIVNPMIELSLISDKEARLLNDRVEFYQGENSLVEKYEQKVMKSYGFVFEQDAKGLYRMKEISGLIGHLKCANVFN